MATTYAKARREKLMAGRASEEEEERDVGRESKSRRESCLEKRQEGNAVVERRWRAEEERGQSSERGRGERSREQERSRLPGAWRS
eukprot:760226-Hanusia_phi.AAC.2